MEEVPPRVTEDAGRPTLRRAPVSGLPGVYQIVLPTPWEVGPVQV